MLGFASKPLVRTTLYDAPRKENQRDHHETGDGEHEHTHPVSVQAGRQRGEGVGSPGLTRATLPVFFSFAQRVRQASFLLQFRSRRIKLCRPKGRD